MNILKRFVPSLLVALGLLALGLCIRSGFNSLSSNRHSVDVRGLAEREVMADKVTWPIVYKLGGDDINRVYAEMEENNKNIIDYLTANGISLEDITVTAPSITDMSMNTYSYGEPPKYNYYMTVEVIVSSNKVETVNELIMRQAELLKYDIILEKDNYNYQVRYEFTGLNDIKPQMIEEATQNARLAAEKFAKDSDSELGKIINASQGQFSIEDRDSYTPWIKEVRIVTYVTYGLED